MHSFELLKVLVPVKKSLKCRENDDFLIVTNRTQNIYYLNDTARYIYENCDGERTIGSIFEILCNEYNILEDQYAEVKEDLVSMIRDFQWQQIIELWGSK